jgi:hypothetical protein
MLTWEAKLTATLLESIGNQFLNHAVLYRSGTIAGAAKPLVIQKVLKCKKENQDLKES